MNAFAIAGLCVAGVCLVLLLIWMLLVSAKRKKRSAYAPFLRPYAHRGLYGEGIPENSLPAFDRAAEAGFGIELDVQLSADGEVFVFHDYTLARVCGREERLSALSAKELRCTRLAGTAHCIPTLAQTLQVVAGRVPLLIELKGESADTSLCVEVARLLSEYQGEWCVESFNPLLLCWFRRHRRQVLRGLLVTDLIREKKPGPRLLNLALSAQWLNFLCRPAFLAWDYRYPDGLALRWNRVRGVPALVYTVRTPEEYERQLRAGCFPIFEGFLPRAESTPDSPGSPDSLTTPADSAAPHASDADKK